MVACSIRPQPQSDESTPALRRAARKAHDAKLAARLLAVGISPYASDADQTAVDLATKGRHAERRGRQLRNIPLFRTVSIRQGVINVTTLRTYLVEHGIADEAVERFVLRAGPWVPLPRCRAALRRLGKLIQRAAEWARKRYAVDVIMRKLKAEPHLGGGLVDVHAHVWAVPLDGADLDGFRTYLTGKFHDFGPAEPWEIDGGTKIDDYTMKGPCKNTDALHNEHLAAYIQQVEALHLWSFLGGLRTYKADLDASDEMATARRGEDGSMTYIRVPRLHRPPRRRFARRPRGGENDLIAIRLVRIDGELRWAALVNNFTSWQALEAKYDLSYAVERACEFTFT